MQKLWIVLLILALLGGGTDWVSAAITQRIIHAGDTPLASTCKVTQTGPMQLTLSTCSWTTTGEGKILDRFESAFAALGVGLAAQALRENKAEWHGSRVRVWLRDKQDNIIERSRTRMLSVDVVLNIVAGETWVVYLVDGLGVTMNAVLLKNKELRPAGILDYILLPFTVPVGTTNLNTINIEVFTVLPGFPAPKGMFEK